MTQSRVIRALRLGSLRSVVLPSVCPPSSPVRRSGLLHSRTPRLESVTLVLNHTWDECSSIRDEESGPCPKPRRDGGAGARRRSHRLESQPTFRDRYTKHCPSFRVGVLGVGRHRVPTPPVARPGLRPWTSPLSLSLVSSITLNPCGGEVQGSTKETSVPSRKEYTSSVVCPSTSDRHGRQGRGPDLSVSMDLPGTPCSSDVVERTGSRGE